MDSTPTSPHSAAAAGPQAGGEEHRLGLLALCALALIVGVATGLGAVVLRDLIGLFHNALYNGTFSYHYDANLLESPSRFGPLVALSPILGGLVVVFLVLRFAPEAKGHGVPEVMDSVFYKRGDIRWQVAVIKSLASALSIGSGAAVGREGPIIQIGAAIGSTFGRAIRLSTWQKITLLAAGAGAGIAATFNTPLGGVMFALEILLPEVSNRTFLPVVVATGAATTIGRWLIGPDPAFVVPEIQFTLAQAVQGDAAIAFVLLGILCGVAAWAFIRLLGRDGGRLPQTARRPLRAEYRRNGGDRPGDGGADPSLRPFLYRWRRLWRHPVDPFRRHERNLADGAAVRAETAGDDGQPRLRRLGRHLLALALSRRDARRRLRRARPPRLPAYRHDDPVGGDRRHGGDGRRGHRRRDDGDRDDLRNDARLRDHRSGHRRRRDRRRRAPRADRRDDLHDQAAPPRPPHPQGAACQSLPRPAGSGRDGARLPGRGGGHADRRRRSPPKSATTCSRSSSSARAAWSAWRRRAPACGPPRNGRRRPRSTASSSRAWLSAATSTC